MGRFYSLYILLCFCSCSSKQKLPENILAPDKMEQVLFDMLRADEFLNQNTGADSLNLKRTNFYQKVFKIHRTSKEQFKSSFYYYQSHPNLLKVVLDSMHNQLNKQAFKPDVKKQLNVKDTIRKVH